jgi:hypothetical protein
MIRVIDLAGYAAPMMVLLMTREMILRVFDMLSHVSVAVSHSLADRRTTALGHADRPLRRPVITTGQ